MSAPANRQRAPTGLKTDRLRLSRGVIGTGVSKVGHIRLSLALKLSFGRDP